MSEVEATVDTIIYVTESNITFLPRFPIIGRDGVNLQEQWDESPECYLSVTAADIPNYFTYLRPTNLVSSIEMAHCRPGQPNADTELWLTVSKATCSTSVATTRSGLVGEVVVEQPMHQYLQKRQERLATGLVAPRVACITSNFYKRRYTRILTGLAFAQFQTWPLPSWRMDSQSRRQKKPGR